MVSILEDKNLRYISQGSGIILRVEPYFYCQNRLKLLYVSYKK